MAAISIGFPWLSFTLSFVVSKLRMRSEIRFFAKNGFANQSPALRTVPMYLPNSVRTLASFGFTVNSPAKLRLVSTTRTSDPATIPGLFGHRPVDQAEDRHHEYDEADQKEGQTVRRPMLLLSQHVLMTPIECEVSK